jgi:SPW repeat-containing protein
MNVRIIPTGVHGLLDYLAVGVNLAFPRLLGLHDAPWAATVPRIDSLAGLGCSLITDYELGVLKELPMPAHLKLDAAKGLFMALSPWLFGFAKNGTRYKLPHVLMGTADVVAAVTTRTR